MARKRKIPVRHHHGVRDPLKQLEEKEKRMKNVINNPPGKDGEKMSRNFRQFKKLMDATKAGKKLPKRFSAGREDLPRQFKNKHQKKGQQDNTQSRSANKIKYVKQLPGENDRTYLKRINQITQDSLREAKYEAKYGVHVIHDTKTGEIKVKKKPPNEIDELLKQKQKERILMKRGQLRKKEKIPQKEKMDKKTARELIKQVLLEEKIEKENIEKQEYQRDYVAFGEVVHAPPTLKTLPRKAEKSNTVPRPGKKNLLLKSLFSDSSTSADNTENTSKKIIQSGNITKTQLKGKRKQLPTATRNMLDKERNKFVELYRNLKKGNENRKNALLQK